MIVGKPANKQFYYPERRFSVIFSSESMQEIFCFGWLVSDAVG